MSRFLPPAPSTGGGGFYGIVVKDDLTTLITDSIEFAGGDFDVSASGDGALVELDASVGGGGAANPGFYGVIFKETETGGAVFKDDQLNVDSNFFYLSSDGSGKPILSFTQPDLGTIAKTFSSSTEWVFNHNLNSSPLIWDTFNGAKESIIPDKVDVSELNTAYFYFADAVAGSAIITTGTGFVISGGKSYALTVENPTSSEDISWFFTDVAITVNKIVSVLRGTSPTVTFNVTHDPHRGLLGNDLFSSNQVASSTSTGDSLVPDNDNTIPANSFVWVETSANSGTVNEWNLTAFFTED